MMVYLVIAPEGGNPGSARLPWPGRGFSPVLDTGKKQGDGKYFVFSGFKKIKG